MLVINESNLAKSILDEDGVFLTLLHPYNEVDDLFFSLFRSFPLAMIPTDVESLMDFKSGVQELLTLAEIKEVDVVMQTRNANKGYVIKTIEDFDMALDILQTLQQTETPDLPGTGNFWGIADQNINYVGIDEKYVDSYNKVTDNIHQPFGHSYDLDSVDSMISNPELVLPKSNFDQAHVVSKDNTLDTTDAQDPKGLRIMDRVAKYGEGFPFLNEDGSLTEAANADILELMLLEASDADLLTFITDGISKVADGVERTYKGTKAVLKDTVGKALEKRKERKKEEKERAREAEREAKEKEREAKEEAKEKEREAKAAEKEAKEKAAEDEKNAKAEAAKETALNAIEKAENELDDVDADKVAKEIVVDKTEGPATEDKKEAFQIANNAVKVARKADVDSKEVADKKQGVADDIESAKKDLRAKDKPKGRE